MNCWLVHSISNSWSRDKTPMTKCQHPKPQHKKCSPQPQNPYLLTQKTVAFHTLAYCPWHYDRIPKYMDPSYKQQAQRFNFKSYGAEYGNPHGHKTKVLWCCCILIAWCRNPVTVYIQLMTDTEDRYSHMQFTQKHWNTGTQHLLANHPVE